MPRVSDQHLAARRQQIVDAARTTFSRQGFRTTTMHDVIAEAGLSVGAVYRYFKSKEDLITAIVDQVMNEVGGRVDDLTTERPCRPIDDFLTAVLSVMEPELGPDGTFRVALQVWSESLHSPALGELVATMMGRLRVRFGTYTRGLQEEGRLPADADPMGLASVLLAMIQGYALQRVLSDGPDPASYVAGLRTLRTLSS
ncbi:MAG: TetR/AcrR family transcriptional regulator [Hamadaea sp.]|nr:TetR/AcrR family transcriptional regulator [Hamadaea sp.]